MSPQEPQTRIVGKSQYKRYTDPPFSVKGKNLPARSQDTCRPPQCGIDAGETIMTLAHVVTMQTPISGHYQYPQDFQVARHRHAHCCATAGIHLAPTMHRASCTHATDATCTPCSGIKVLSPPPTQPCTNHVPGGLPAPILANNLHHCNTCMQARTNGLLALLCQADHEATRPTESRPPLLESTRAANAMLMPLDANATSDEKPTTTCKKSARQPQATTTYDKCKQPRAS